MSTCYYSHPRNRWVVKYVNLDGHRVTKRFPDEAEALSFVDSITDERLRTPGPDAIEWTDAYVRNLIAGRTTIDAAGCWRWTGRINRSGYAVLTHRVDGIATTELMHRASYRAHIGPFDNDLQVDHLCNVPRCVNPVHLDPVTGPENIRRRDERRGVDPALLAFNASRAFYGLPPVDEIPSPRPTLTVVPS